MPGSDCRLVNSAFNHMQECNGFELIVTVKTNVVEKFFIFSQDVKPLTESAKNGATGSCNWTSKVRTCSIELAQLLTEKSKFEN